jgi:hypothetical protein
VPGTQSCRTGFKTSPTTAPFVGFELPAGHVNVWDLTRISESRMQALIFLDSHIREVITTRRSAFVGCARRSSWSLASWRACGCWTAETSRRSNFLLVRNCVPEVY